MPENAPKVNYKRPGFIAKFLELQQVMWTTNAGLTERHAEQPLHRQTGLDRSVAVVGLPLALAGRQRLPCHVGIEPDGPRATALERLVVGCLVLGLVGRRWRSAHAEQLPVCIDELNPLTRFVQQGRWT